MPDGHGGMSPPSLFTKFLKFDARAPLARPRSFILFEAGHGSMLPHSLLHLTGYADMTLDELEEVSPARQPHRRHPEYGHASGYRDDYRTASSARASATWGGFARSPNGARGALRPRCRRPLHVRDRR